MTVAREALRLATVQALRGATLVGDRVRDSAHGPVEDWAGEAPTEKPFPEVIVYTDDSSFVPSNLGPRDLLSGGTVDLVIEIVMTQKMEVIIQGGDGETAWEWGVPHLDAAMEFTIAYIERQIALALHNPTNRWAEVWGKFALSISERKSRRGTWMRDGVRAAGRQIILSVEVPRDPAPGDDPVSLWTAFLDAAKETGALAAIVPVLTEMIYPPIPGPTAGLEGGGTLQLEDGGELILEHNTADLLLQGILGLTTAEITALHLAQTGDADATIQSLAIDEETGA